MKRIFLLKGLDCPNCSAKIEKEVGELDGVQSSVVNLMKQNLTIRDGNWKALQVCLIDFGLGSSRNNR